jgi:chromosome segregation ATPase
MSTPAETAAASRVELVRRRVESEIAKNNAECGKFTAEADKLRQRWYSGRSLFQAIIGGIVASALLATWIIGYLQPILTKNEEVVKLELKRLELANTIQSHLNELQRQENDRKTKSILADNERAKVELTSLATQNSRLHLAQAEYETRLREQQTVLNDLAARYSALANRERRNAAERAQLLTKAQQVKAQSSALNADIRQVVVQQAETRTRAEQITTQLETREIRGAQIVVVYTKSRLADATAASNRLTKLGATVSLSPTSDTDNERFIQKIFYNSDNQLETAKQIKAAIADIEPVEIAHSNISGPKFYLWIVRQQLVGVR